MDRELIVPKTIQELVKDEASFIERDILNGILNQPPPAKWIKEYQGFKYLPIDKHEYLLKRLFQNYRIEILREGQLFNSIYCTVRVHYIDPLTKEWTFQDGTGAVDVQKVKGSSPAQLENVIFGAIMKGLPAAESYAIKDATEKIGNIFGSNLNRKDTIGYELGAATKEKYRPDLNDIERILLSCITLLDVEKSFDQLPLKEKADKDILKLFNNRKAEIKNETDKI